MHVDQKSFNSVWTEHVVSAAHFENGTAFEAHFVHMTFAECFVARVQQQNGCQQGFKNSKHIK